MTVQEMINSLMAVEDKTKKVMHWDEYSGCYVELTDVKEIRADIDPDSKEKENIVGVSHNGF